MLGVNQLALLHKIIHCAVYNYLYVSQGNLI